MKLDRMTVGARLNISFGIVLSILGMVAVLAIIKVHMIETALRANSEENALIQRYAINFRGSAHDRSIATRDVVLSANPVDREKEVAAVERLARFYAESAGPLEKLMDRSADSVALTRLYGEIKSIEALAVATTRAIVDLSSKGDLVASHALLWSQAKPHYVQWLAAINKLIDFEESRIQAQNKIAFEQASGFLVVMLSAVALSLVVGVGLARSISRGISRQLGAEPSALVDAAQRVSDGNLHSVPGAKSAPEGSVLASLGAMQVNLARLVGQVRDASESIATGSAEIATGNADLSQRTEQQASNLQVTAASMVQMNITVKNSADTAREASQLASSASATAAKGGSVVGEVVTTMDDITASSRKIADIIGVIDGIAFQTNILALNAAVEAARAGEQGRGFAVVASEVRSLAQRSAAAAKEIKSLIGASVGKVETGSRLVADAGATMNDIVSQVRRVSDLIADISSSTLEQTTGIGQVSGAVSQLDTSTQQNAALVEQSAAAAGSLKQQAVRLNEVVALFQLDSPGKTA